MLFKKDFYRFLFLVILNFCFCVIEGEMGDLQDLVDDIL